MQLHSRRRWRRLSDERGPQGGELCESGQGKNEALNAGAHVCNSRFLGPQRHIPFDSHPFAVLFACVRLPVAVTLPPPLPAAACCCLPSECRLCPSWRPKRVHTPIWHPTQRNAHSSCRASWKTTDREIRSTCNNSSASQTDNRPFSTSASMTCIRYTSRNLTHVHGVRKHANAGAQRHCNSITFDAVSALCVSFSCSLSPLVWRC
jgi:hypothetical protein